MSQNGKGKGPEKGRDLNKFRSNYDNIDWSKGKGIRLEKDAKLGDLVIPYTPLVEIDAVVSSDQTD